MQWLFLLLLFAVMKLVGSAAFGLVVQPQNRVSLSFGFLVLAGFLAGQALRKLRLPALTGYLLAGMICGPQLLGALDLSMVEALRPLDRLALFFIALTAGCELEARVLRPRLASLAGLALGQLVLGGGLVVLVLYLLAPWLPFPQGSTGLPLFSLVLLVGLISVAKSPATTLAVILETRAKGPLRDTVLGTTLLMEVLVVTAFTVALSWSASLLLEGANVVSPLGKLMVLVMSIGTGALVGLALRLYLEHHGKVMELVILLVGLLLVQLCADLGLDPLLLAIAAGFVVRNTGHAGEAFLHKLEQVSQPVFLAFFGLVGAGLDLERLMILAPAALLLVLVRLIAKRSSIGIVLRLQNADEVLRRHAWKGFLGQAGFTLGLAGMIATTLPGIGGDLRDWVSAAVVIHLVIGPILFKRALKQAGETQES